MEQDRLLRQKVRELLENGELPITPPDSTWGGPGGGGRCVVCGMPVGAKEMGVDLEYRPAAGTPVCMPMHVHCFSAWDSERHMSPAPLPSAPPSPSPTPPIGEFKQADEFGAKS